MLVKKGDTVLLSWPIPKSDPGSTYTTSNVKVLRTLPDGSCQEVDLVIQNSTPTVDGYFQLSVLATWEGLYECVLSRPADVSGDTVYLNIGSILFTAVETATLISGMPVPPSFA